jgi:hypothetical protein
MAMDSGVAFSLILMGQDRRIDIMIRAPQGADIGQIVLLTGSDHNRDHPSAYSCAFGQ